MRCAAVSPTALPPHVELRQIAKFTNPQELKRVFRKVFQTNDMDGSGTFDTIFSHTHTLFLSLPKKFIPI